MKTKRMLGIVLAFTLLLNLAILPIGVNASATVLFTSTFDDASGWTYTVDGRYFLANSGDAMRGSVYDIIESAGGESKNLKMFDSGVTSGKLMISFDANLNTNLSSMWINLATKLDTADADDTQRFVSIQKDDQGKLVVGASTNGVANVPSVVTYTKADAWAAIDILIDVTKDTAEMYVDGQSILSNLSTSFASDIYGVVLFSKPTTNGTSGGYIDNFTVRTVDTTTAEVTAGYEDGTINLAFDYVIPGLSEKTFAVYDVLTGNQIASTTIGTMQGRVVKLTSSAITPGREYVIKTDSKLVDMFGNTVNTDMMTFFAPVSSIVGCIDETFTGGLPEIKDQDSTIQTYYASVNLRGAAGDSAATYLPVTDGVLMMKPNSSWTASEGTDLKLFNNGAALATGSDFVVEFDYKNNLVDEYPIFTVRALCSDAAGTAVSLFEDQKGTVKKYDDTDYAGHTGSDAGITLSAATWYHIKCEYMVADAKQKITVTNGNGAVVGSSEYTTGGASRLSGKSVSGIMFRYRRSGDIPASSTFEIDNVKLYRLNEAPVMNSLRFSYQGEVRLPETAASTLTDSIALSFNKAMDEETLSGIKIYTGENYETEVAATGSYADDTYTLTITNGYLPASSSCRISIPETVTDTDGNAIAAFSYGFTTDAGEVIIKSFELLDAEDNTKATKEDMTQGKALKAVAQIVNTTGSAKDYTLLYAAYSNNEMKKCGINPTATSSLSALTLTYDMKDYGSVETIKVFLFDSFATIKAYCEHITL